MLRESWARCIGGLPGQQDPRAHVVAVVVNEEENNGKEWNVTFTLVAAVVVVLCCHELTKYAVSWRRVARAMTAARRGGVLSKIGNK